MSPTHERLWDLMEIITGYSFFTYFIPQQWVAVTRRGLSGTPNLRIKRGITIPLHSQELWVVCRGILQLRTFDSEGNEAILGLAYPEMPFGLPFTQIDPYEVIALSDVVLMRITQIELERSSVLAQGILSHSIGVYSRQKTC
nr:hypothetical protein [Acaryochloris sp. CCMEE 5410]